MKIKGKKLHYDKWFEELIKVEELEIECEGLGTKDDPAKIDSSSKFPKGDIQIFESDEFVIITNRNIDLLTLRYSENIVIRNCKFKSLKMVDCKDIIIEDSHMSSLRWFNNQNCLIKNSITEESIHLYKCSNNTFINCEFWNLFTFQKKFCGGNKFENCEFSGTRFKPNKEDFEEIKKPVLNSKCSYSINRRHSIIELDCIGYGTKESPYIIDKFNVEDQRVREINLFFKRDYIIFKNFNIKVLRLYDTKHVTLENCKISKLCVLKFCEDLKINFTPIKRLKFGACQDTLFTNSDIKEIEVYGTYILEGKNLKKVDTYKEYGEPIELRNCTTLIIRKLALPKIKIL